MARRRMHWPQFYQSQDVAKLNLFARYLFQAMVDYADDEGKGIANPVYLRSTVFPYDEDVRVADVRKALESIGQHLSVTIYNVDGNDYYRMDHWKKWQTIDRPTPSIIPDPQNVDTATVSDDSTSLRRVFDEQSTNNRRTIDDDSRLKEKKRKEINIKENKEKEKRKENIIINLECTDKELGLDITDSAVEEWEALYPSVDIKQELGFMKAKLKIEPKTELKTFKFINSWLANEERKAKEKVSAPSHFSQTKQPHKVADIQSDKDDDYFKDLEDIFESQWIDG